MSHTGIKRLDTKHQCRTEIDHKCIHQNQNLNAKSVKFEFLKSSLNLKSSTTNINKRNRTVIVLRQLMTEPKIQMKTSQQHRKCF